MTAQRSAFHGHMLLCLAALGAVCVLAFMPRRAVAEQTVEASFGLGSEYNDNVTERRNGPDDFVSHIKPEFRYKYDAERVAASIRYKGDYAFYMRGEMPDDYSHTLEAKALLELVEKRFFLDISENLRPVYRQASRGELIEGDTRRDQTDQNIFAVSPYVMFGAGERFSLKTGYRFTDIRYAAEAEPGSGSRTFLPGWSSGEASLNRNVKQQHDVFADGEYEMTDRVALLSGYQVSWQESEQQQDFIRHRPYMGIRYEYMQDSTLQVRCGPMLTETDYGERSLRFYYSADLAHALGRHKLTLRSERDYTEDPQSGKSILREMNTAGMVFAFDRSRLTTTLGYATYDSALEGGGNKFWRPGISYAYDLTERLTASAGVTAELDAGSDAKTTSDRIYCNAGLNYALSESSWLALTYRYKAVDSSDAASSFNVNRIMVEWGMTF